MAAARAAAEAEAEAAAAVEAEAEAEAEAVAVAPLPCPISFKYLSSAFVRARPLSFSILARRPLDVPTALPCACLRELLSLTPLADGESSGTWYEFAFVVPR